jgi:hypothetical protein
MPGVFAIAMALIALGIVFAAGLWFGVIATVDALTKDDVT